MRERIESYRVVDLVDRIQKGDLTAEHQFVERYSRGLSFMLRRLTRSPELAEDLHQETFKVVLERLRSRGIDEPEKLGEFLSATARNLFRVELRNRRRRSTEGIETLEEHAAPNVDPHGRAVRHERIQLIHQLIGELRHDRDRQLLYRFYIAEEDKDDICLDLGLSALHFNRVLFRARQRFKDLLTRFEKRRQTQESHARLVPVVALLTLGSSIGVRSLAGFENAGEPLPLQPGVPIERQLSGGQAHLYRARLPAGDPWLITVKQSGIDVVVTAETLDGQSLGTVDAPTYRQMTETLLLPKGFASRHSPELGRIEVRSLRSGVASGRYSIQIQSLADASAHRLAAEAAMSEAGKLHFLATQTPEEAESTSPADLRQQAMTHYQEALTHWRALEQLQGQDTSALLRAQARTLFTLGALAADTGAPERALALYTDSLKLWQKLGDGMAEAETLSDIGLTYWKLGDDPKAGEWLRDALFLQKRLGHRYGEAVVQHNLCLRAHSQGDLPKARDCYLSALDIYRQLGERDKAAILFSNLGSVYRTLSEPERSREHHLRALELRRQADDRAGQARTLNNLAVLAAEVGEPQQALDYYQQALDIFLQLGDRRWQGRTLSNLGAAYFNLGELQRAQVFLVEALSIRQQTGDRRGEIATLNHLGHTRRRLGEFDAALADHGKALALAQELGNRREEARSLELLGRAQLEARDYLEAHATFEQTLKLARATADRLREAEVLGWRGEAEIALGRSEHALLSLDRALSLHRASGDRSSESLTLRALARADRRLGRIDSARDRLEEALSIFESLRSRVLSPKLRASLLASHYETYELLIDTLMALHGREPRSGHDHLALEISERSRARTLLEHLESTGADDALADPEHLARRRSLERRLSAKTSRQLELFRGEHTAEAWQNLEYERQELIAELESLEAEVRQESADPASLERIRSLTSDQIRPLLEPDSVLLQFALGARRSFLWWVEADSVETFELPGKEEIEAAARRCHEALSTLDLRAGRSDLAAAAALSQQLLAPVADRLEDQRLVIVADGALHYVPFAALPVPGESTTSSSGAPLLIERHEIVYLPSASTLAARRRQGSPRSPSKWAAVLGDPVFSPRDPRASAAANSTIEPTVNRGRSADASIRSLVQPLLERSLRDLSLERLERLPSTRREAKALLELAPAGEVLALLDFEANRSRILAGELRGYQVVHFGTHGLINDRDPDLSGLVLSLVDPAGRPLEGFLRLRDISQLDLSAELVVLSGCQTALGQEVRGEGLWGLTRGFLHAGVPRVAASLWRVEDRGTAELMTRFYRGLRIAGLPASAALRRAQLELREERNWRDPYFWAGFVLQGDWR